MQSEKIQQFHHILFKWWREQGRVLPWREKEVVSGRLWVVGERTESSVREKIFAEYFSTSTFRDPYRVVVAEVMLQQTQVDRVKEKYEAWMKKWPKIKDLANATLAEVIIEWKGLGYNRRARFLWLLAKEITQIKEANIDRKTEIDGWPVSEKELLKLSGIGRYTARAVMSFSLGQQVGVVDTNIKRIFSRIFREEGELFAFADSILPPGLADPWNQALMDFGALICTAKKPKCEICPVFNMCQMNLEAVKEGYKNYSEKLVLAGKNAVSPISKKSSKDMKDGKKIPFEQTDRYLRGRIVDVLRQQPVNADQLAKILHSQFPQFDELRIENSIQQLLKEEMLKIQDKSYSLG